jgi:hypothetical protein
MAIAFPPRVNGRLALLHRGGCGRTKRRTARAAGRSDGPRGRPIGFSNPEATYVRLRPRLFRLTHDGHAPLGVVGVQRALAGLPRVNVARSPRAQRARQGGPVTRSRSGRGARWDAARRCRPPGHRPRSRESASGLSAHGAACRRYRPLPGRGGVMRGASVGCSVGWRGKHARQEPPARCVRMGETA